MFLWILNKRRCSGFPSVNKQLELSTCTYKIERSKGCSISFYCSITLLLKQHNEKIQLACLFHDISWQVPIWPPWASANYHLITQLQFYWIGNQMNWGFIKHHLNCKYKLQVGRHHHNSTAFIFYEHFTITDHSYVEISIKLLVLLY